MHRYYFIDSSGEDTNLQLYSLKQAKLQWASLEQDLVESADQVEHFHDRCVWAAAGSVDTDLSFLSFLELYRTDVAQRRMAPGRVVEPLDVIEDVSTSLLPGPVYLPSRSLCLQ